MISRRELLAGAASVTLLGMVKPSSAAGLFASFPGLQGGGQYLRRANMLSSEVPLEPYNYYNPPGNGAPAVSTCDYYLSDGLYWFRPYDLLTMGTPGATIAAARGARYVWLASCDHIDQNINWSDGTDPVRVGFSNDPGIPPPTLTRGIETSRFADFGGQTNYHLYQAPYLVYNPDDAVTPFWVYCEGAAFNIGHEEGLAKSADLINWTVYGYTHKNNTFLDWASFQRVVRVATGNWYSIGLSTVFNNYGGWGKWTSTDGQVFTQVSTQLHDVVGNSVIQHYPCDPIVIGGQTYIMTKEDNYNIPPYGGASQANGPMAAGSARIGMYVSLCPIDANFNAIASPPMIRISSAYSGVYPGPTYLQNVSGYVEDGVLHIWATHGFFTVAATPAGQFFSILGAPFMLGGGLQEQFVDYYTYIVDASAAALAAPVGVAASCDAGVVTLTWYDALPQKTYRVYKGTTSATQATLVGDISTPNPGDGFSTTDSPTPGQEWWYKVVTLDGGTERQNRVVHTYVTSHSELVNRHIMRVIDDGGDPTTIDQTWLETCVQWAITNGVINCIQFWADAAFGVKLSAGKVVKVYCLGTTILPRGADLTMATANVTYSATGMNGVAPGWTKPNNNDFAYFGGERLNNIRKKLQVTAFAVYKKPDTIKASFIGLDMYGGAHQGLGVEHLAGSPGSANFYLADVTTRVTADAPLASATGVNVIIGFYDGTNVVCYGNGVAGTPQGGLNPNLPWMALATTLKGQNGLAIPYPSVVSGSSNAQANYSTGRTYFQNQAKWTASCIGLFSIGLTDAQAISFDAMQATHIGR